MTPTEFVTLELAGEQLTFRALDFDQLEALEAEFAKVNGARSNSEGLMDRALREAVVTIATESLRHRHADITPDRVRKLITLATWPAVLSAVAGVSGLLPTAGAAPQGEGTAGA